jgi:hypothetical protein
MNPGLSPSSNEKGTLNQVAGQLASQKAALASELHQALRARDMSNRMLISPWRQEKRRRRASGVGVGLWKGWESVLLWR